LLPICFYCFYCFYYLIIKSDVQVLSIDDLPESLTAMTTLTALILGIGNTLLSDEGVGVHVIRYLRRHYPDLPAVHYLDGGTLSFTLAEPIANAAHFVVIDAAELHAPPGTVRVFADAELDHFLGMVKRSVHEVGLLDLLAIARLTDSLPARRALIGIQPHCFDWSEQLSAPVAAAIPAAAGVALRLLQTWREKN